MTEVVHPGDCPVTLSYGHAPGVPGCVVPSERATRPTIVCLCGSTRFAETFNEVAEAETLAGRIVVRPEVVAYHRGRDPQLIAPQVKAKLDELHLRKIDLADEVLVLNVGGYVGESTKREIHYAWRTGKVIRWIEPRRRLRISEMTPSGVGGDR